MDAKVVHHRHIHIDAFTRLIRILWPLSDLVFSSMGKVDERREWSLPKLRPLSLTKLMPLPDSVESEAEVEVERRCRHNFRIKDLPFRQLLWLDWKETYADYDGGDYILTRDVDSTGFVLGISQGTNLLLDGEDSLLEMHIIAPLATKLSIEGCEYLKVLDIDCPFLLNMVTRSFRIVVGKAERKEDFVVKCNPRKLMS